MTEGTKKKKKTSKGGESMLVEKDRGTQDEIEILKMIIEENPALRQRVMEKIKAVRKMSKL